MKSYKCSFVTKYPNNGNGGKGTRMYIFCVLPPRGKTLFCNAIHGKIVNFYILQCGPQNKTENVLTSLKYHLLFTECRFWSIVQASNEQSQRFVKLLV